MALIHSSFVINVTNVTGFDHKLISLALQKDLTYTLNWVPELKGVYKNGFVFAVTHPGVVAVGAGADEGNMSTCHCVAVPASVQFIVAEVCVIAVTATAVGFGQVGGGAQVILATHPGLLTDPSLLKTNVKQPLRLDAVNGPGIMVPQYDPASPPGTFPGPFALGNNAAGFTAFPSYTYNPSQLASVLNNVNVTVTC